MNDVGFALILIIGLILAFPLYILSRIIGGRRSKKRDLRYREATSVIVRELLVRLPPAVLANLSELKRVGERTSKISAEISAKNSLDNSLFFGRVAAVLGGIIAIVAGNGSTSTFGKTVLFFGGVITLALFIRSLFAVEQSTKLRQTGTAVLSLTIPLIGLWFTGFVKSTTEVMVIVGVGAIIETMGINLTRTKSEPSTAPEPTAVPESGIDSDISVRPEIEKLYWDIVTFLTLVVPSDTPDVIDLPLSKGMGGPVVWLMDSVVVCLSKRLPIIDVNSKQNAHKPIYTVQTKTAVYHSVGLSFIDKDAFSIQAQSKSDSNNIYTVTYSINGTDWNSAIVSTDDHDKYERWKNTATQSKT